MIIFGEEVYRGYSLTELSNVRTALAQEHIKYKYKIINLTGPRAGYGSRHTFIGMNHDFDNLFVVIVHKSDFERAKFLADKARFSN